jgi:hypothetical protein
MMVALVGISLKKSQAQIEAQTVSMGVNKLTSAAGAYRVELASKNRAKGPNDAPMAKVAKNASLSIVDGAAGIEVTITIKIAAASTTSIRGKSG